MSVSKGIEGFTFGCDPEVFILDDKGQPVSAAGIIPGSKNKPHVVKGGSIHPDGMAAEFGIDPSKTFSEFNRNIETAIMGLMECLPQGYSLSMVPHITFSEEAFNNAPDDAKELGCNPDFDTWTGGVNPPPSDPDNPYRRTASGHLHVGFPRGPYELSDTQHILNCCDLVQQFDWYLGAWSIRIDSDPVRRRLYGQAGAYRPKTYGVEYRVLSNFWITTRERRLAVWNRMQKAIEDMRKSFLPDLYPQYADHLKNSINYSMRNFAMESLFRWPLVTIDA